MDEVIEYLKAEGAFTVRLIHPSEITTAPWTVMKCRYGCPHYGHNRSCPPFAPDYRETQRILDSYRIALIFGVHNMAAGTPLAIKALQKLSALGYYKAIGFGTGPCTICTECKVAECKRPYDVLPSPEACGIDVIATVRRAGLPIDIPPVEGAQLNCYGLILPE